LAFQGLAERGSRRSPVEMVCDIMAAIGSGIAKPTLIAYRANVSWAVLNRHLSSMQEKGLVKRVRSGKRVSYLLTEKGFVILAQYRKIREELGVGPVDLASRVIAVEPFAR